MSMLLTALILASAAIVQAEPGAKAMFYNPGGIETQNITRYLTDTGRRLREVNYVMPLKHCGIHYWFETEAGVALSEQTASRRSGSFTLFARASCDGFLTIFDMGPEGRELTPRTDPRWSGHRLSDEVYRVGTFSFSDPNPGKRLIVVWARSQTEVARDGADAAKRLVDMPKWMKIVSESEESAPGEIGTYVVNRSDAGVAAEVRLRRGGF